MRTLQAEEAPYTNLNKTVKLKGSEDFNPSTPYSGSSGQLELLGETLSQKQLRSNELSQVLSTKILSWICGIHSGRADSLKVVL